MTEIAIDLDPETCAMEECAELITALCHLKRGREGALEAVQSEIADVLVVLAALRVRYGASTIDTKVENVIAKLERLRRSS